MGNVWKGDMCKEGRMCMMRRKDGKMQKRVKSCIKGGDRKKRVKREYIERGKEMGTRMNKRFRKGRIKVKIKER